MKKNANYKVVKRRDISPYKNIVSIRLLKCLAFIQNGIVLCGYAESELKSGNWKIYYNFNKSEGLDSFTSRCSV